MFHVARALSHAIVSSSVGPEYYVCILSFVDKTQLEPGCSVLLHYKVRRGPVLLVRQDMCSALAPIVHCGELSVKGLCTCWHGAEGRGG